ncbi:MAG: tetratricopeptide repeat protein [Campylobacterales bacterium]
MAAGAFALAAEPSAFRAGNLSSSEPYGLTETEKEIHENRQAIERLEKRLFSLEQKTDTAASLLEGVIATTRANSEAIRNLTRTLQQIEAVQKRQMEGDQKAKMELDALHLRQEALEKQVNEALNAQAENQKKLADSLAALQKAVGAGVSREGFDKTVKQLVAEIEANRRAIAQLGGKAAPEPKVESFSNIPPETLLGQAKTMIEAKEYDGAHARLAHLLSTKYKAAETTFYLGTLYYFQGENDKAIAAFKQSAQLDDQARYMPVLLYYTAIVLERQKNNAEARRFYETLLRLYPEHDVATGAKRRLEKLP